MSDNIETKGEQVKPQAPRQAKEQKPKQQAPRQAKQAKEPQAPKQEKPKKETVKTEVTYVLKKNLSSGGKVYKAGVDVLPQGLDVEQMKARGII